MIIPRRKTFTPKSCKYPFYRGVFKSRTFSLISRIPNERTSIWKLRTKHERRKQGWREEARATSKTNRGGRVNARKGEYKGIRHGYCKSPGETRNLSIPCFFFTNPCCYVGCILHRPDILFQEIYPIPSYLLR